MDQKKNHLIGKKTRTEFWNKLVTFELLTWVIFLSCSIIPWFSYLKPCLPYLNGITVLDNNLLINLPKHTVPSFYKENFVTLLVSYVANSAM